METRTFLYIILSVVALILIAQYFIYKTKDVIHSYSNEKNEWSELICKSEMKILKKYAGEIPFGPIFIHLKTDVQNIFKKEFFSNWFYKTDKGVLFQKWNSNPLKKKNLQNITSELIYIDFMSRKEVVVLSDIKSFWLEIKKDEKNHLILVMNNVTSKEELKLSIPE
ncbi:hypothetical protein [Christiangramia echinicola]|uniref:Uncharacterized protein n=1 Tax=Christiangramia echinicola TaxID=279359 RepID=A0A1H1LA14_9FLAO|nr:hypothetical protein [Christiangramia echinicola]SDR71140.1 hypothetical protein SAMN04488552_0645 [Christiangramia echinicola]SDR71190.1 hypothetical protein SAMN04488552_0647 [Christiangramia echinicola]